jgi:amino acid adenylation domain-containing protein
MSNAIYSLLERAACDAPSHTAVAIHEEQLSYDELHRASGRVAALLRENGAEPGCRVAFAFEKSMDALISLFAIIRTGATYIPLDPGSPAERISAICEDADVKLWVGTRPPPESIQVPAITSRAADQTGIALRNSGNYSESSVSPTEPLGDLANVLFTSGSTGRPKGVQITATSLLHFAKWSVDYFELRQSDRISNHAPYTFDLSTFDIFAAVRAAATMCPVPDRTRLLPFQVAKLIEKQRVSVWYSVPSALILMKDKLAGMETLSLRHVIFAGEVMPKSAFQALARELSQASYTNLYGPTETNVCTYHRVTESDLRSTDALPIGRPICDTGVWICDDAGNVLPDGTAGELLVAGPTVTTGYLADAELTRARLVAAPDGSGVAFRTGDCVSRDAEGLLQFHGRLDRMIKCRGYRIEPGEIEGVLCRHPAVDEAVVIPVAHPTYGSRIKAYVATSALTVPCEADMVALCREHLPGYMVPEIWSITATLPRNDRGKVDLQALIHN